MSPEEIEALWTAHFTNPTPATLEALVLQYEPLAAYLARRALAKAPAWQDRDEILSFAHDGLLDAIAKFRPDGGAKFETYATRRIGGAIIDWQRRMDPLTRPQRKAVKALDATINALENELGREVTTAEVAERMDIDETTVLHLLVIQQSLEGSIDDLIDKYGVAEGHYWNFETRFGFDQEDDSDLSYQLDEIRHHLARSLTHLLPWQRAFMVWHYCEEMSLRELARMLGLHESRCSQFRTDILRRIRSI